MGRCRSERQDTLNRAHRLFAPSSGSVGVARSARGQVARLDDLDIQLMAALQRDARQSLRTLSRHLGLSRSALWERMKRLEQTGLILGYQAQFAPSALGADVDLIIGIDIQPSSPCALRAFEAEIKRSGLFTNALRLGGVGRYQLRSSMANASRWLEVVIERHGLRLNECRVEFIAEELAPYAPPIALDVIQSRKSVL